MQTRERGGLFYASRPDSEIERGAPPTSEFGIKTVAEMCKPVWQLREVLDCGSPLPLFHRWTGRRKSGRGLPQSRTLARDPITPSHSAFRSNSALQPPRPPLFSPPCRRWKTTQRNPGSFHKLATWPSRKLSRLSPPKNYVTRNNPCRHHGPTPPRKISERAGNFPGHRPASFPGTRLGHLGYQHRLARISNGRRACRFCIMSSAFETGCVY